MLGGLAIDRLGDNIEYYSCCILFFAAFARCVFVVFVFMLFVFAFADAVVMFKARFVGLL